MPTYKIGGRTLTEKQYQELLKSKRVSERGRTTVLGAVSEAVGLPLEAQARAIPSPMPDVQEAQRRQRKRRRQTGRGRISTIFTSGLGG
jgi:predicted nucleic acid-binding Zn ribbon protein